MTWLDDEDYTLADLRGDESPDLAEDQTVYGLSRCARCKNIEPVMWPKMTFDGWRDAFRCRKCPVRRTKLEIKYFDVPMDLGEFNRQYRVK